MFSKLGDGKNGRGRLTPTRKCLNDITINISKLLAQYQSMDVRIKEVQEQCKEEFQTVHDRVSDVRKGVAELNVKLTHYVSYSKGKRAVWRKLIAPMWVSFGALIGVGSTWFWDVFITWVIALTGG